MAPRRAAAVSAASSISQAAAGPSTPVEGKSTAKQARQSSGGQQENTSTAKAPTAMPIVPAQPLSPIVARLRKMWKFAAVCQFLFTFDEAFGMSGFETEALEEDLDGSEKKVIPDLMRRLLYTLTFNRSIDESNWEDHLRAQYLARHPDETLLGTIEEPFPWSGLPLWQKIETLHQACEWQLWDAERFRKLVKNEEEAHVWRIDPIGWDSKDNTYWLFDDNRLWIQHPRPAPVLAKAPPKKSSKKAKLEAAAAKRAAQRAQSQAQPQKRKREEVKPKSTPTRASGRNKVEIAVVESPAQKRGKTSRRSATAKDGWEEIPPELLYEEDAGGKLKDDDDDSELSDPPPADEEEQDVSMADDVKVEESIEDTTVGDVSLDVKEEIAPEVNGGYVDEKEAEETAKVEVREPVDDWIEFETIAVTRQEWEAISVQFAKSKHPDEKSLHLLIKNEVMPKVLADLAEAERQRAHEAAMANRKRSSRIALKESEREEKERDRVARLKMEEKMAGIRDEEERAKRKEREEVDAAKLREERLREREDRMAAREREAIERVEREIEDRENRERMREMRKMKREQIIASGGIINESEELQQSKADDEDSWELDCEVCGAAGINPDDNAEIVCCEICGRWQHTECWNAFDRKVGRGGRNWEKEDFFCSKCKPPQPGQPWPRSASKLGQNTNTSAPTMQGSNRPLQASPLLNRPPQPAAIAAAPQRPMSITGMPFNPNVQHNYSMSQSSPIANGHGQQWSQQQQQYYAQQQSQLAFSHPQYRQQTQQLPQQQYQQQLPQQRPQHQPQLQYQYQQQQQQQQQNQPQQQRVQQQAQQRPQQQHPQQQHSPLLQQQVQRPQQQPQMQHPQQQSFYSMQQGMQYPQQSPQPMYSQAPTHSYYQQQQQQPIRPQTVPYSPSTQSYSNGHSYVSQAPLSSPSYRPQIPSQQMQRQSPVQSPLAKPMDGGSLHTAFNDSRREVHAPSPTSQGQPFRPAASLPSPRAPSASPARSLAPLPSPQAPTALPAQSTAALPSPQPSTGQPAPMLSNPFASNASPARPLAALPSPQGANTSVARPMTPLPSPQAPMASSTMTPISPNTLRSPSPSPKTTSSVPRNIATLPTGSFALRRNSSAKSPLSRPEGYTSPSIPAISLGQTAGRATSPSPLNRSPNSNLKTDPLFNRQTVLSTFGNGSASSGPGPSSGSLARVPPSPQSSAPSQTTSVALPSSSPKTDAPLPQPQAKTLGPSPPRPTFGGEASTPSNQPPNASSLVQAPPPIAQVASAPTPLPQPPQQFTPQVSQQGNSQP